MIRISFELQETCSGTRNDFRSYKLGIDCFLMIETAFDRQKNIFGDRGSVLDDSVLGGEFKIIFKVTKQLIKRLINQLNN